MYTFVIIYCIVIKIIIIHAKSRGKQFFYFARFAKISARIMIIGGIIAVFRETRFGRIILLL